MSYPSQCPSCSAPTLSWRSLRRDVAVDVLVCDRCQKPALEEDWTVPARALRAGRCINCGEARVDDSCRNCALSRADDLQVHYELRDLVGPGLTLIDAARKAVGSGRRVLGLKLATASCVLEPTNKYDSARGLRIWLLSAVGEPKGALQDAKLWVEQTPHPSSVAWASLAQQLEHAEFNGAAADAYSKALEIDGSQLALRARRARLLAKMQREGQALKEVCRVFAYDGADDATLKVAISVAEGLMLNFEKDQMETEIEFLINRSPNAVLQRSAILMAYRARLEVQQGNLDEARVWLKGARRLLPDHPLYGRVQRLLRPSRSSWWKW